MSKGQPVAMPGLSPPSLSTISPEALRRFEGIVAVRDQEAFVSELERLVQDAVEAATQAPANASAVLNTLKEKAAALRAPQPWAPSRTDLQRGRAAMLEAFERPENLSVPNFARLSGKSRQQIYKDIAAKRLLALNVGRRGLRIPEWQLEPLRLQLTQRVLSAALDVDEWTLCHALSDATDRLAGDSPIHCVHRANLEEMTRLVLDLLDIHAAPTAKSPTPEPDKNNRD